MIKDSKKKTVIVVDEADRPNGQFEDPKTKKMISYEACYQLVFIEIGDKEIKKAKVNSKVESLVKKALSDVHYGALVSLEFEKNSIIGAQVIDDLLADYFEQ